MPVLKIGLWYQFSYDIFSGRLHFGFDLDFSLNFLIRLDTDSGCEGHLSKIELEGKSAKLGLEDRACIHRDPTAFALICTS